MLANIAALPHETLFALKEAVDAEVKKRKRFLLMPGCVGKFTDRRGQPRMIRIASVGPSNYSGREIDAAGRVLSQTNWRVSHDLLLPYFAPRAVPTSGSLPVIAAALTAPPTTAPPTTAPVGTGADKPATTVAGGF
jgi:hypothetical protein